MLSDAVFVFKMMPPLQKKNQLHQLNLLKRLEFLNLQLLLFKV